MRRRDTYRLGALFEIIRCLGLLLLRQCLAGCIAARRACFVVRTAFAGLTTTSISALALAFVAASLSGSRLRLLMLGLRHAALAGRWIHHHLRRILWVSRIWVGVGIGMHRIGCILVRTRRHAGRPWPHGGLRMLLGVLGVMGVGRAVNGVLGIHDVRRGGIGRKNGRTLGRVCLWLWRGRSRSWCWTVMSN